MTAGSKPTRATRRFPWLTPGAGAIGVASFLSDVGHEVPTSLLPSLLTVTLGAPAAALGLIEGVADGISGVAKLAGGALADDPHRRRNTAIGGYTTKASTPPPRSHCFSTSATTPPEPSQACPADI
jgi:hypothetical protein